MKSKRRREDILTGILMSALKGSSKTRIMYDNGLNFRQLKQYINYAVSNGLLGYVKIIVELGPSRSTLQQR